MNMCGMTVAVLEPYSLLNSIVKILCSYDSQDRHHKLSCDKRMFLRSLADDAAGICRCIDSDHGKKCLGITAYTFTVQLAACKYSFNQLILLVLGCKVSVIFCKHVVH